MNSTPVPAAESGDPAPRAPPAIDLPLPRRMGRYWLDRMLASGGMGAVYLAHADGPAGFQKTVVIKCILDRQLRAAGSESVELFLNEGRLTALLAHPNIVQTFELGEDDGVFFLAMEYVDGIDLRSLHRTLQTRGERVPVAVAVNLCVQVLHALHHAHTFRDHAGKLRPILHRDISPENVLLSAGGTVKVADFGVARMTFPGEHTTGLTRGKVAYMAPERLSSTIGPVDGRCDLFSTAVMLYELLADARPFGGPTPLVVGQNIMAATETRLTEVRPDVPEALAELVHRALAKRPDDRFSSALELAAMLESFATLSGNLTTQGQLAGLAQSFTAKPRPSRITLPVGAATDERPTTQVADGTVTANERGPQIEAPSTGVATAEPPRRWKRGVIAGAAALLAVAGGALWSRPPQLTEPVLTPEPVVAPVVVAATPAPIAMPEAQPEIEPEPPHAAAPTKPKPLAPVTGKGTLELRVHPWAEAWVDGKKLGNTPLEPVELQAGRHQLRLVNADLAVERKVSFWLSPHTEVQVGVNLLTHKVTTETHPRADRSP